MGALSAAERSHPTSEFRGRSREDPMPAGRRPRGVTPRPRSGAAAESTRLQWRRNGREELLCVQGQGVQLRGDAQRSRSGVATRGVTPHPRSGAATRGLTPRPRSGAVTRRVTLRLRSGAAAGRRYPMPQAQGQGRQAGGTTPCPHAPTPEAKGGGLEEQPHARGQGRWPGGPTPHPRSHGCVGAGGPRGTIPR